MMIVVYVLAGLLGLCVGSFLNVVIYRVPNGMSIATPPSHCPKCGYRLRAVDNIPVLSYVFLGGKCHNCKERISFRYTAVELLNMALWLLCVLIFWKKSIVYACMAAAACSVFICIAFIDLEHQLIFDRFIITLFVLGVVAIIFGRKVFPYMVWYDNILSCVIGGGLFLLVWFLGRLKYKRDALGGGDIKLAAAMGLLLGWRALLFAVLIVTVFGSIILLILKKAKNYEDGKEYPFAPFLAAGAVIALLVGNQVVTAYLSLF